MKHPLARGHKIISLLVGFDTKTPLAEEDATEQKETSAEDTLVAADDGADETLGEPSTKQDDDGENEAKERLSVENLVENDKTMEAETPEDGTEEPAQRIESSVVESTETSKALDADTSISQEAKEDEDVEHGQVNTESKDTALLDEKEPTEADDDDATSNDEKLEENVISKDINQEQHEIPAVSNEKDTDAEVTNEKESGSLGEEETEATVEDEDESDTSEDEQDSQNTDHFSKVENETNANQEQITTDEEREKKALPKDDSMEVEPLPSLDEEKSKDGGTVDAEDLTNLTSSATVESNQKEENILQDENSRAFEEPQAADNEEDNGDEIDTKNDPESTTTRSVVEESLSPEESGSINDNSSTPAPSVALVEV
ncbi:glutamic acid-rich protein-like [Anopheles ziemanni]|uniref:glutamic acid-rich protein-like n=1 Tax=Anopheles ziemanni TaxID=345580 RepID=UPI00265FCA8B|nr:glutamic acid-rich protein-like [Anopheles ziemanni]